MQYANLKELLYNSSSSRNYFFALSVKKQLEIHSFANNIHNLFDLRLISEQLDNYNRHNKIANLLFNKNYNS